MDIGASFKITAGVAGQRAVDELNNSVGRLGGLAKTAALGIAGLGSGVALSVLKTKFDEVVASASGLKDMAERVSSTVERVGELARVANISGAEITTVEGAIVKMSKALAGQDDASRGAANALEAIGLNIKELRSLDPVEAFKRIAAAFYDIEGSAGKTAAVMDIFGKSGAQVIPFMNDIIELGPMVSRVTTEQANTAEEYEQNLKRLAGVKQDLYRIIANELLPVANAFVKMLVQTTSQTDGVRQATRDLAADGSLRRFFMEGARAAAAILDVLSLVGKALAQIGESFATVINDVVTVVKVGGKVFGGGLFSQEGRNEILQLLRDREALVAEANKRMADRWKDLTPYSTGLEAAFADPGSSAPPRPKSDRLRNYQSRDPVVRPAAAEKADPYETELQNLNREAAKLAFQSQHIETYADRISVAKEAQIQFDIEQGKFKDLTDVQKQNLLEAARSVDRYAESLRQAQQGLDYDRQTEKIRANTRALGQSAIERERIAAMQDLENRGIREGTELYDRLAKKRMEALEEARRAQGSLALGLRQGFNDYMEIVSNNAQAARDAFVSAFRGMEDALVNFTMTGKLNFRDMARSILADITRIWVRQQLIAPLLKAVGGMIPGGGSAGWTSGFDLMNANGNAFGQAGVMAFASGGVVNRPTLFPFANGGRLSTGLMGEAGPEAIVPLKRGRDGRLGVSMEGGGNMTVNVVVNAQTGATEGTDGNGLAKLGGAIAQAVRAELINQKRPGGILAPA